MIKRSKLEDMYNDKRMSMSEIAAELSCSVHKVAYWMKVYGIPSRSRSAANYTKHNPGGDPFKAVPIDSLYLAELYGTGIGLYWGEGTKSNKHTVRLGNTDAKLIKKFVEFLEKIYCIDTSRLRFSIQVFSDIDPQEAEIYWQEQLGFGPAQFTKTVVTKSGSIGTYSKKSKYGVLTLYFHNTKLRNILIDAIPSGGVKYVSDRPR